MKYTVNLSDKANKDTDEIFEYISTVLCEKEAAVNMINLLQESILSLDEMPGRYRLYENELWKKRGVHIMPVKKYLVFYLIDDETKTVNVIRVIYASRDYEKIF